MAHVTIISLLQMFSLIFFKNTPLFTPFLRITHQETIFEYNFGIYISMMYQTILVPAYQVITPLHA